MAMDLSIIVPVYNTREASLKRCFQSIFRLHNMDFELLIVDDGSQKSVGDYCEQLAGRDTRCRYFRKENGGVSSARNMGLAESKGDFVMFVDSDDEVLPDTFCAEAWGGVRLRRI